MQTQAKLDRLKVDGYADASQLLAGRRPLETQGGSADAEPNGTLLNRIRHATSPYATRTSLGRAWILRIAGKADEATAVLRECARLGGEVPYLE